METKRSLAEVEKEIAQTKLELENVHGTETEVYARIVGYYRAVKHWNNGKKDEFNLRKLFTLEDSKLSKKSTKTPSASVSKAATIVEANDAPVLNTKEAYFEMYTRKTCPNCPPVKAFMEKVELSGRNIDVDTKEGLAEAAKKGVFASPTVIFYNEEGIETARCHNVEELEAVFSPVPTNC